MKAKVAKNIDEYIADFPADVQKSMEKVRATIKKAAPRADEAIKYQIPTFVLNGNLISPLLVTSTTSAFIPDRELSRNSRMS